MLEVRISSMLIVKLQKGRKKKKQRVTNDELRPDEPTIDGTAFPAVTGGTAKPFCKIPNSKTIILKENLTCIEY